jgi:hypothetical protein
MNDFKGVSDLYKQNNSRLNASKSGFLILKLD